MYSLVILLVHAPILWSSQSIPNICLPSLRFTFEADRTFSIELIEVNKAGQQMAVLVMWTCIKSLVMEQVITPFCAHCIYIKHIIWYPAVTFNNLCPHCAKMKYLLQKLKKVLASNTQPKWCNVLQNLPKDGLKGIITSTAPCNSKQFSSSAW